MNTPPGPDKTEGEVRFLAEVRWISIEGGFYGLIAEDGRKFFPLKLPDNIKKDGLKVRVKGKISDVATIYMWGTPFEVHEIKTLKP